MDIEIVEFYTHERHDAKRTLKGTLHIYIPEFDMDIRGFLITKHKKRWFVYAPAKFGIDEETKQAIRYPVVNFVKPGSNKKFLEEVKSMAAEYIEKNILHTPGDKIPNKKRTPADIGLMDLLKEHSEKKKKEFAIKKLKGKKMPRKSPGSFKDMKDFKKSQS